MYDYDITVCEPDTGRLSAVVEVRSDPPHDEHAWREEVGRFMLGSACHYGLLVTPSEAWVLRDTFQSDDPESIEIAARIPTSHFFEHYDGTPVHIPTDENALVSFAADWLRCLAGNWFATLSNRPEVLEAMVPGFVGAATEAMVNIRKARTCI